MLASTCRRSASVRATNRCSKPAPKSNPSSTTYTVSIRAAIPNHNSTTTHLPRPVRQHLRTVTIQRDRAMRDLAANQEQEQDAEHEIQSREAHQRKQNGSRVHHGARAVSGAHQPVHDPGL